MSIPTGSVITEAMITAWQSLYSTTRAQAIADLSNIEDGRILPPSDLASTFDAVVQKGASLMSRSNKDEVSRFTPKRLGIFASAAATIAAVTAAAGIFTTISGNVPNTAIVAMTTATTTPCAIQNDSDDARTILAIGIEETGTAASLGAITIVAGTGTTAFSDASHTKFLDSTITKVSGERVLSTTSTVQSAYAPWGANEWITFKSGTTTHSGYCKVLYY